MTPVPTTADGLQMPMGACDCHTHVFGDDTTFPMSPERQYTPAPAPVEALLAHMEALELQRIVIVQASVYGTDNRCLLDTLARLEGRARGVAVPHPDADATELRRLHRLGVRGLRINLESDAVRDTELLKRMLLRESARIADLGWHLQLYASPQTVVGQADVLATLPVPVVLDHFAMVPLREDADADLSRALLSILRASNVYLKLSAPYRLGPSPVPGEEAQLTAKRMASLLNAAPRQLLWGSDWPHTARDPGVYRLERSRYRTVGSAALRNDIFKGLTTPQARQLVLADNPARLYGF